MVTEANDGQNRFSEVKPKFQTPVTGVLALTFSEPVTMSENAVVALEAIYASPTVYYNENEVIISGRRVFLPLGGKAHAGEVYSLFISNRSL